MEENKVIERLAEVIDAAIYKLPMTAGVHRLELAKAILQSPDLRVTLEPGWEVHDAPSEIYGTYFKWVVMRRTGRVKESQALFVNKADAEAYIQSKEPK